MASVLVAMSGGVDSSVAAALLKDQGYEVVGVTMRLVSHPEGDYSLNRGCCTLDDAQDARRVAYRLDITHYIVNLEREFRTHVVDYFAHEYMHGRTPNPCTACNRYIKFDALLRKADELGVDFIATGHYARIEVRDKAYRLMRAVDVTKDQSYVLYMLGQNQLRRLLLPVGHYRKDEIRSIAAQLRLPVARKPDSQEICFVPNGNYRDFISRHRADALVPGPIVDTSGRALGQHPGIAFFTIGQRRGLGLATGRPLYVVDIKPEGRTVVVGSEEELLVRSFEVEELSFVAGTAPDTVFSASVKIRYRSAELPAVIRLLGDGTAEVELQEPARGIAPGQAAVFYRGDEVLGGGIIRSRR
jgi:tRNA-specific 2-thiouridylase